MTIKRIDRDACRIIRERIDAALVSVGKELGISIKGGNASFAADGKTATFKVEVGTIGDSGQVETKEATDFKRYAKSYGLESTDLGKPFNTFNGTFTIVGAKPRAYKMPIIATNANGKRYKFSAQQVLMGLGRPSKFSTPYVPTVSAPGAKLSQPGGEAFDIGADDVGDLDDLADSFGGKLGPAED